MIFVPKSVEAEMPLFPEVLCDHRQGARLLLTIRVELEGIRTIELQLLPIEALVRDVRDFGESRRTSAAFHSVAFDDPHSERLARSQQLKRLCPVLLSRQTTPGSFDAEKLRAVEERLAEVFREYETLFYEKVSAALDEDADKARRIIAKAKEFLSESGVAKALTPTLLEHIRRWPSWSIQPNFGDYCGPPFSYLGGEDGAANGSTVTNVKFAYEGNQYEVRFAEAGMEPWDTTDSNLYGRVELISEDKTVLGLDVVYDLSQGDVAYWAMTNVYAFLPGEWMKNLLEMASYINGKQRRALALAANLEAKSRANNIDLLE